jgi:hypothetical protein
VSAPSLADQAVAVLAAVSAIDAGITNDHPERHQIRSIKRLAEQHLADAMRHAHSLAYLADDARNLARELKEPQP